MRNRMGRLVHGHNRIGNQTPTHVSWRGMIQRTTNKNAANYERFGGRAVTVCERWRKFENFLADLGPRPKGTTLGRVFDIMPYAPDFANWQTPRTQLMHKLSRRYFEARVKGWTERRLNAVAKFITTTIANAPDVEPDGANDLKILELLNAPPQAA